MAEERTEEATGKRKEQARSEGQIPKSQDFNAAIMLGIGLALLFSLAPLIISRLKFVVSFTFNNLHPSQINPKNFSGLMAPYASLTAEILLPFLLILLIAGIVTVRAQVGHLISWKAIKPKFDKLSPMKMVSGLKNTFNIFSPKKLVELAKSFAKLLVIVGFAWNVIENRKDELLSLLGAELTMSFATISDILGEIIINMLIAMLFIGIIDKRYQKYEFDKSIKMTKQEVKDERKNIEGDPKIKAKIKAAQFKFAQQRMMSEIPTADVVVTNPTHYAVALRYDTNKAPAPQVVAKGVDFIAFKIREVAENNNVPIIENPPLARTLHKIVPLEGLVPAELYMTVAEVLAYVYKKNKR